jgi:hypothetical protein
MLGGTFDPFSRVTGNSNLDDVISPGVHIGIVKRYIASTKSCMVLVPTVNDSEPIGPVRIMNPFFTGTTIVAPAVNTKVVVAFLDGAFNNAVILGYLQ